MPSHCCVPLCSQQGYRLSNGEKVSYFNFPKDKTSRKQWIHAIRRSEGPFFKIHDKTKVCSLHFKPGDLKKSLNGRVLVQEGKIPSRFEWRPESPKKRKAPTVRQPLVPLVRNKTNKNVASTSSQEHVDFTASKVSGNEELLKKKVIELKRIEDELERKLKYTEGNLRDVRQTICNLRQENDELKKSSEQMTKQIEILRKQSEIVEPLLDLNRLTSDRDIAFYTGFPNYDIFIALFYFLNPGAHGENVRYVRAKPGDFNVTTDNNELEKKNCERKREGPRNLNQLKNILWCCAGYAGVFQYSIYHTCLVWHHPL